LKLDAEMDSYLWRFQDVVLNFSQTKSTSVIDFLHYWSEKKEKLSILPPDGINAVKIYTIHKSKGLQFPVVIFPYCNWSMKPKPDATIWIKNDENPFDKLNAFPVEMIKKMENSFFVDEYQKELEATYIDNINMLYVAFTRAEEQLYILSDAEKNSSKTETLPQNVSKLLYDIVPQLNLNQATHNINEFSYGNNQTITEAENDELNVIQIEPVNYHNFKEKMPLHRENNYNEAQIKGNILHTVLSKINQANQLRKAVATTTIEDVGYYTSTAQKVMEIFAEHNWFDEKWIVLNERNLYFNQQLLRADKVLLSNEECVIIDYKTGAKDNKHIQQMREYMNAYAMLYTQKISAYLVYIENTELIQVQ
jgi:ATP-dependent exoDNAse (exonuclease V) beta subunit